MLHDSDQFPVMHGERKELICTLFHGFVLFWADFPQLGTLYADLQNIGSSYAFQRQKSFLAVFDTAAEGDRRSSVNKKQEKNTVAS